MRVVWITMNLNGVYRDGRFYREGPNRGNLVDEKEVVPVEVYQTALYESLMAFKAGQG